MAEQLFVADYISIAIYFALVLIVGLWSTFKPNRGNVAGYFLAGKDMHWFPVGASIFASNVGAPMFIGLSGTAAASGFACAIYEWHAIYLLIALGWIYVPVYVASGAFTMPEYLKKRFGGTRLRVFMSVLSMLLYVLTKISSEIFSGAIFLRQLLGWNLYACIAGIMVVTALYTVVGGLAAVIYTDTLQTVILLIGASILFIISMMEIGGWSKFMSLYAQSASNKTLSDPVNYSCGLPRSDFMHIWRDPLEGDIPWTGAAFGLTVLGIWCWCTDQIIVQRCLAARNMSHSKGGAVFGAVLKSLSFIFWVIPGMISRIFFPDEIACADPVTCMQVCGNRAGCTNIAYPLLVLRKMPEGLRGLMMAALLAALMSTLTSIFNSASSMFTMDIWRRFRKRAPQHELMIVGRVFILVITGLSVLWIPVMEVSQGGQLWNYFQTISACISPPWVWAFLLALFWQRTTEQGAFWGIVVGTAVGFVRMILEFTYSSPPCGSFEKDERPSVLKDVHFLHFAMISSGVSIITTVAISLLTKPRPPEKLRKMTWWTRHDEQDPVETESEDDFAVDDDGDVSKAANIERQKTCYIKMRNWVCGIEEKPHKKLSLEEKLLIKKKMTDIKEHPTGKLVTAVAACIAAGAATFLIGFFH